MRAGVPESFTGVPVTRWLPIAGNISRTAACGNHAHGAVHCDCDVTFWRGTLRVNGPYLLRGGIIDQQYSIATDPVRGGLHQTKNGLAGDNGIEGVTAASSMRCAASVACGIIELTA